MKILITQGETRGIGPEVVLKVLASFTPPEDVDITILGDPEILAKTAADLGLPVAGNIEAVKGESIALAALERAAELAMEGRADAIVTAPVHKALLKAAGFTFPGQTEFFATRFGAKSHAMMLATDDLRVVPVTTHLALRDVPDVLTRELIADRIETVAASLIRDFGIENPRIAVLGLNPHAGEEGHFGDEEAKLIAPVIESGRAKGLDLIGPLPADAAFLPRARAAYDAIIGMYHDQVLGPFKALSSGHGVNVTVGLPVIRTSPDHGTAMDIAGKGVADAGSFACALRMALALARRRRETPFN
jgi:4-hydroxythreonine-4-phosphate dehydrogenase